MTAAAHLAFYTIAALAVYASITVLMRRGSAELTVDLPNERSSHSEPVLRGAGLAIAVVTVAGLGAYGVLDGRDLEWRAFVIFMAGAGFVALVSWIDDVHRLSNRTRLLAQAMAALNALAIFGYLHVVELPVVGQIQLGYLGLPLTFVWIVGLANAFNFMDGSDGLAGSQAVVAGIILGLIGILYANPLVSALGFLLAATCIGFLPHNWPPARIFMGDVGSVFLGYTFAVTVVLAGRVDSRLVFAAALVFAPVLFDTIFTFVRRTVSGQDPFRSHRSHLYQRLIIAGWSHRAVALLYMNLAIFFSALALLWTLGGGLVGFAVPIAAAFALVGLWIAVVRVEGRAKRSSGLRRGDSAIVTPIRAGHGPHESAETGVEAGRTR